MRSRTHQKKSYQHLYSQQKMQMWLHWLTPVHPWKFDKGASAWFPSACQTDLSLLKETWDYYIAAWSSEWSYLCKIKNKFPCSHLLIKPFESVMFMDSKFCNKLFNLLSQTVQSVMNVLILFVFMVNISWHHQFFSLEIILKLIIINILRIYYYMTVRIFLLLYPLQGITLSFYKKTKNSSL